jgi:fucose permease
MTIAPQNGNTRSGKIAKTTGYYLAFFVLGLIGAVLGPSLNSLAEHTRSQISQISILFTTNSIGYFTGSFFVARLYDRVRGHTLMGTMLVGMAVTISLAGIIPTRWLLAVILLLLGIAQGTVDVGANTLLVWVHHPNSGPFMNGLHFFYGAGAFFCPLIIAWMISRTGDIQWAYWILALITLPAVVWVTRLPSPTNPAAGQTGPATRVDPVLLGLMVAFFFLNASHFAGFTGWVYTYAIQLNLAGPESAALLTSLFWGGLTIGRLLSIPISVRAKPRTILLVDLLGVIAAFCIVLFWPARAAGIWAGTILMGLSQASIFPTMLSFAEKRMAINGKVTGYFFVGSSLGCMIVPWVCGQLFDLQGPQAAMVLLLAVASLNLALFGGLMKYSKKLSAVSSQLSAEQELSAISSQLSAKNKDS